jgi:hypothetical protein
MEKEEMEQALNPGEILGLSGAYWKSLALHAGVRLDLFTVLGEERLAGEEIAGRIDCDTRGVTTLLNALAAMGLLAKEKGRFSNTPAAKAFLVGDSPRYVGSMVRHHANLVDSWSRLDEAARTGAPVRSRTSETGGTSHEDFIMGMHSNSMGMAPRVAEEVDLGGRRKLLDLGGGPGTWSVHFVRANPRLTATVFDLPATRPFAEKTIARFGVSDHVTFHAGDFNEDELPCCYDVAWLSHILHGEGPESARRIIEKTVGALEAGGLILVHEFILDEDKAGPLFPALFSLNMLSGTPAGRSYSQTELEEMLEAAGVGNLQMLPFRGPTESRIISGTVA